VLGEAFEGCLDRFGFVEPYLKSWRNEDQGMLVGQRCHLNAALSPQIVVGGVGGDAVEPFARACDLVELRPISQRLDKGLVRQIFAVSRLPTRRSRWRRIG
jgi:hypothetical protein